ncbi:FAD-dependent oxidoreductase [Nocardiopsis changdeensis]|uniref:FAD-dependent oxidoreductase n=1 Tax=Nocardiopsis changdeensis TaxID=2831969 RepID=UPI003F455E14
MRVLVSGGGIGGPALALALHRAGIDVRTFEAHPGPAAGLGSHLGLAPNGLAVLHALGAGGDVIARSAFPSDTIEFTNGRGRVLGRLRDGSAEHGDHLRTRTITRGRLQTVLAEAAARAGVPVAYGRRLVSHTDHGGHVTVSFADGGTARGDVLIGADGIHSPVRRTMAPAAPGPAYTGLLNMGGSLPAHLLPATPAGTTRMVFGRRAFLGYQTGEETALWFVNLPHPDVGPDTPAPAGGWQRYVLDRFSGDAPYIAAALAHADPAAFTPTGIHDIASLPRWSRGRVGLLGDAAHAMAPSSGQGASQALEDALVLASCLRDIDDPARALATYEHLRRDRVERVVALGRRQGSPKLAGNAVTAFLRDLALPLVFRAVARTDPHREVFSHRIDPDRPVRPAGVVR